MANEVTYATFGDTSILKGDSLARAEAIAEAQLPPDAGATEVTEPQQVAEPETQETNVEQPQADSTVDPVNPSEGSVLEVPENALVRVKIDGEVKEVPYKEFKDSLQREAAWHKRQQTFAEGKKQLEQYYAQQFAELEAAARAIQIYEQQLRAQGTQKVPQQAQQTQTPNPDEIATIKEVQQETARVSQTLAEQIAAQNQAQAEQLQRVAQQLKKEMIVKENAKKFDQGLNGILNGKDYESLKVIPNLEQNLRYQVWQLQPQTIDEAVEFAERIAKDWNAKLKTVHIAEQQKVSAQKAKAKLEPSDGSPPKPGVTKPKSYINPKTGKLDHAALRQAAMALLD